MKAPETYADWQPLLDRYRDGDDEVLPLMQGGAIEWTDGVAQRWTARLDETLDSRLKAVSRQLQTALSRSRGEHFGVASALLAARRGLSGLQAFAQLPAIPPPVAAHLSSQIERFARETQRSLESSARLVRSDHGLLLKALRDNPLTAGTTEKCAREEGPAPSTGRVRRVLI